MSRSSQLAVRLRTLAKLTGLTYRQIARRAGLPERRVGAWMRGENVPSSDSMVALLTAMISVVAAPGRPPLHPEHASLLDLDESGPWWEWRRQSTHREGDPSQDLDASPDGSVDLSGAPQAIAWPMVSRVSAAEAGWLFVGRETETEQVLAVLTPAGDKPVGAGGSVVCAVAGMGGVGKTALARHCAAVAVGRDWFPGGVFFVDMQGYGLQSVGAGAVFPSLLRWLGVQDRDIGQTSAEQAVDYHKQLERMAAEGLAVLVVVDNASTVSQVRPLVPTSSVHRTLVTTRDTLSLQGARRLSLDVLDEPESVRLLDEALREQAPDDERISADHVGTLMLTAACGRLPLALRITVAILAAERGLLPGELATQLREAGMEAFTDGEEALAGVLDLSWQHLLARNPQAARLLRLLIFNPGPDVAGDTAAVLADQPKGATLARLRVLRQAHLLQHVDDRWRMHDLIWAHTSAQPAEIVGLTADEEAAAVNRLLDHYLHLAEAADQLLEAPSGQRASQPFTSRDEALAWLDTERPNLTNAVRLAAGTAHHRHTIHFSLVLGNYLKLRRHLADRAAIANLAYKSAPKLDDLTTYNKLVVYAGTATDFGNALLGIGRLEEAILAHQEAVEICRKTSDRSNEAWSLNNLGTALRESGQLEGAISALQQAVKIFRELGDGRGTGSALNNLGNVLHEEGQHEEAVAALQQAVKISRDRGDQHTEGAALTNLGIALREEGKLEEAIASLHNAVEVLRATKDRHHEGGAWENLGGALHEMRRFGSARQCLEEAAKAFADSGDLERAHSIRRAVDALPVDIDQT